MKLNKTVEWFNIELSSIKGDRILSKVNINDNFCLLNISSLAKGLYLVKVSDNKGNCFIERLIKE